MRPKKLKVLRNLSETQLQIATIAGVGIVTVTSGVGVGSTTFDNNSTYKCFTMIGRRKIRDQIEGFAAISGNSAVNGDPGGGQSHWDGDHQAHRHGGCGGAAGGSNFIAANLNVVDGNWCIACVGCGCTASFLCSQTNNAFMMANRGNNGHNGQPAGRVQHGEHFSHHNGSPGTAGLSSSLLGTCGTDTGIFVGTCCVQGCPGSGCPIAGANGGQSGYQNSVYCGRCIVPQGFSTSGTGNSRCFGCGGWVHLNLTGRNENRI